MAPPSTLRSAILAGTAACALAASAEPIMIDGGVVVRLLDSECSSEVATGMLVMVRAATPPKRADVTLFGQFVPACWAEDRDGDILLADRHGSVQSFFRWAFQGLPPRKSDMVRYHARDVASLQP